MEELAVGDTKYKIGIHKTQAGFSITWNCPLCRASGMVGFHDASLSSCHGA